MAKKLKRKVVHRMKPALVYGADEFFGLSFCEHLLEEGVNIDVKLEQTSDEKS